MMNAAKNILKVGASTCGLDTVRPSIHIEGGVVRTRNPNSFSLGSMSIIVTVMAVGVASAAVTNRVKLALATPTPSTIVSVSHLDPVSQLSPIVLKEFTALTQAEKLPLAVVQEMAILLSADKLTEQNLVDFAMLVESNKLDLSVLKQVVALMKIDNHSRFNSLSPSIFSTLWVIKMKGLKAERNKENTDDLWRKYWEVFMDAEE